EMINATIPKGMTEMINATISKGMIEIINTTTPKETKQMIDGIISKQMSKMTSKELKSFTSKMMKMDSIIGEHLNVIQSTIRSVEKTLPKNVSVLSYTEHIELENIVSDFTSEDDSKLDNERIGIKDYIDNFSRVFLDYLPSLKDKQPSLYIVLNILKWFLLIIVINPLTQDNIKHKVYYDWELIESKTPSQNVSKLNDELSKEFDYALDMVNKVRITNRNTIVYQSSKRNSGKIDEIPLNNPVIIIHKKKNWAFVSYMKKQEEMTGWVLTGNLEKSKH
ncbi:hypothetical protein, partial [Bacillus pacificus]|uniref:hypothetical protein n=1 Tax=Bacillus pacificus TaxID=2026187 RepID=UPI0021CE282E